MKVDGMVLWKTALTVECDGVPLLPFDLPPSVPRMDGHLVWAPALNDLEDWAMLRGGRRG